MEGHRDIGLAASSSIFISKRQIGKLEAYTQDYYSRLSKCRILLLRSIPCTNLLARFGCFGKGCPNPQYPQQVRLREYSWN